MLDLTTFRARFVAFADTTRYTNDFVTRVLDEAWALLEEDQFGDKADIAHGYLSGHLLLTMPPYTPGEMAGMASRTNSDGQSLSMFAPSAIGSEELMLTAYGRVYLKLQKQALGGTMFTLWTAG